MKSLIGTFGLLALLGCGPSPSVVETDNNSVTKSRSVALTTNSTGVTEIDLGLLKLDEVASHNFQFRNQSDSDLTITQVVKTCGCEASNVREGTIVPAGDTLSITYSLSKYGVGHQTGQLTLHTDSTADSMRCVVFKLSATTPQRIWSEPKEVLLIADGPEVKHSCELKVYAIEDRLLKQFVETITTRGLVEVKQTHSDGKCLTFKVTLSDPATAPPANDYMTLLFSDPRDCRLDIRVRLRSATDATVSVSKPGF